MKTLILLSILALSSCGSMKLKRRVGPAPDNVWTCPELVQKATPAGDFYKCRKDSDVMTVEDPR